MRTLGVPGLREDLEVKLLGSPQSPKSPRVSPDKSRKRLQRKHHRRVTSTETSCLGFPASPGLVEETMMDGLANNLRLDYHRPIYHVAPRSGWLNDPNGPFFHQGEYHLFFQHIVDGCEWDFGIVWGHAVSKDLVHWEHMSNALLPTPGSTDADGCFSGCSVVDKDGTPTILYTGVRLRSNPACGPLPPTECDLNLPFIETQLVARADEDDSSLETWVKQKTPMIAIPPPDMNLVGWRDPYIFETLDEKNEREWGMLMGSGIRGQGGSVMIYRSKCLSEGWRYDGMLCQARDLNCGAMWECPLLIELNHVEQPMGPQSPAAVTQLANDFNNMSAFCGSPNGDPATSNETIAANDPVDSSQNGVEPGSSLGNSGRPVIEPTEEETSSSGQHHHENTHFLCISPDAPTNPVLYWLGDFDGDSTRFLLDSAKGPLRLDLGDILYAPNLMVDEQGRHILWGWLQERRKVGTYDYAGCLSLPRLIYKRGDRLIQEPIPEIAGLRHGRKWKAHNVILDAEDPLPLGHVGGNAIEVQATFERGASAAVGFLIRSWDASGEGGGAIVYDWERGVLEAIFEGDTDLSTQADLDTNNNNQRRIGGEVDLREGESFQMRLLLDGSVAECYLSSGEVLSTRIYRGNAPRGADAGVELVSFGGVSKVESVQAWELKSIWHKETLMKVGPRSTDFDADSVMGAPTPV